MLCFSSVAVRQYISVVKRRKRRSMIDPHNGMMPQPDRPINKPTLPNQGDGPTLHGRPVSMPDIVFQIVLPVPQDAVATLTSTVQATFPQAVVTLAQGQILSQGV